MTSDPAKTKFFTHPLVRGVGWYALLWLVMWLGISVVRQDFSLEYLLLLPLALVRLSQPSTLEVGYWGYMGIFVFIFWASDLIMDDGVVARWEVLLQAFAWAGILCLIGMPVSDPLKWSAVIAFGLWAHLNKRRGSRTPAATR